MFASRNQTDTSTHVNWARFSLALVVVALVVFRLTLFENVVAQQTGWPTPPPGPVFPVPSDSQINATIGTSVESPGSAVQIVRPSWPGQLPLIPPVPSNILRFSDPSWDAVPLTLRVEAGTFSEVVQIRVRAVDPGSFAEQVRAPLLAYEIEVLDASGRTWDARWERPVKVSTPVAALVLAVGLSEGLLYYTVVDDVVTPLVSALNLDQFDLTARLLGPGVLVIADPS